MARKRRSKSSISQGTAIVLWLFSVAVSSLLALFKWIFQEINALIQSRKNDKRLRIEREFHHRMKQYEAERALLLSKAQELDQIDKMSGGDFEEYVAILLDHHGFQVSPKGKSGDLGVDLVAAKGENLYAIQIKRQKAMVSRRAVSDAVAGKGLYDCNASAVITNNYFSTGAIDLAKVNNCLLIDRDQLVKMMLNFQGRQN